MIEQNACKYRVKARAKDFTNLMATAHFNQMLPAECEMPSPCFNAVVTGFLLDGSSLPSDFARGLCQTNYDANKERIC